MRVAQAYSLELVMDEAATTGRFMAVLRSLAHAATTGVTAFFAAFGLFVGYSIGAAFIVVAIMKPIFPNNVGFWMTPDGMFVSGGVNFPGVREGLVFHTSYWIIPIALLIGYGLLLLTHSLARAGSAGFGIAGNRALRLDDRSQSGSSEGPSASVEIHTTDFVRVPDERHGSPGLWSGAA